MGSRVRSSHNPRPKTLRPAAAPLGAQDVAEGLRATIELAPVGIAQFARDGRFLFVNAHLADGLGYSRDELLALTFQEITFSGDLPECERLHEQAAEGAIPRYVHEKRFLRRDGSFVWVRVTVSAVRHEDGVLAFFVGIAEDITERRRAEEELARQTRLVHEEEARLRALVEASPLGIVVMDLDGNPIFYNPMAEALHGIPLERASGRGWAEAVHPDDRERVASSWYETAAAGAVWAETYRFLHADGRVVWVSGRAAPMRVDGHMVGFVGTLEDITALKLAEQAAERATRRRDDVMAFVAHDLRNPLHAITASASLMIDVPLAGAERVRQLEIIRRSAQSMDNLIRDLLDVAQLESGTLAMQPTRVDVHTLVAGTLELFEQIARGAGVTLESAMEPDLPSVRGDPDRLRQLLANLLSNAIQHTPEGGRVEIRATRHDGRLRMTVEDTGNGISPEQLPHIFDRFWRGGSGDSERGRAGTGLGLAISKAIVEAHDGRIEVQSTPGRGAAFQFTLPLSLQ